LAQLKKLCYIEVKLYAKCSLTNKVTDKNITDNDVQTYLCTLPAYLFDIDNLHTKMLKPVYK